MSKNKVEVVIGGNIYSLQGDESNQHIQQVAGIINQKILEMQGRGSIKHLSTSQVNMLAAINIADEYLKTKDELNLYIKELEKCSEENLALMNRIEELGLEINKLKTTIK